MNLRETIRKLNALQRSWKFQLGACIAICVIAIGVFVALWVVANDPATSQGLLESARERAQRLTTGTAIDQGPLQAARSAIDSTLLMLGAEDGARIGPVVIAIAAVAGLACLLVKLGLGLTFFGLLALGWGIAWPLMMTEATRGIGQLLFGSVPLMLVFLAGVEVLKLAFAGPGPVSAIARNMVNEAIRMKISVVFIVLLILLLALVPGLLNEAQPLRYRIQQWLQYGIGLSYAVLTLLTLFLCVSSVTTEQRDRIIWQTMSKPTPPWKYLLGKWVGVMSLNALLLAVTAGGVFMFTEYLRFQPAEGEIAYKVPRNPRIEMTEDRRLLETQVLVARVGKQPEGEPPSMAVLEWQAQRIIDQDLQNNSNADASSARRRELASQIYDSWFDAVSQQVEERWRQMEQRDQRVDASDTNKNRLFGQVMEERMLIQRSIPPGRVQDFLFLGLQGAKERAQDITLIFKVQSGSNDPAMIYNTTIFLNGIPWPQVDTDGRPLRVPGLKQVHLDTFQYMTIPYEAIGDDGSLQLSIVNGAQGYPLNPLTMTIPPDGLEVLFPVGSYGANFTRIMFVLWIKLGFIAAVSLMAATFLSFPVASLVSLSVLFAAESAGYLHSALEFYTTKDIGGELQLHKVVVRAIAMPVAAAFQLYAELKPSSSLVDGRLVSWGTFLYASVVVGGWTVLMVVAGWLIFRRRELALYSGH